MLGFSAMKRIAFAILVSTLAAPTLVEPAQAFSVRLSNGTMPAQWATPHIEYWLQMIGSDNLTPEESQDAIYASFQAWVDVSCSALTFEQLGDVSSSNVTMLTGKQPNGKNELVFIEDESWTLGKYVLGVTAPIDNQDGFIFEADIAFNGYLQNWTVSGKGGTDLMSVAVHEIGHMFGLQHNLGPYSWQQPPTMAPNVAPNNKSRTLETDDEWAACYLYPADGEWPCQDDDMCPRIVARDANGDEEYVGRFVCGAESQLCDEVEFQVTGISGLGEECTGDAMCVDGLYCQNWQDSGVCTGYCETANSTCPEGFICEPFQSYPQYGACLPEDGQIAAPGQGVGGCTTSAVCADGEVCVPTPTGEKKACTTVCDAGNDAGCPEGWGCWLYSEEKDNGVCFPYDTWPDYEPPVEDPEPPVEDPEPPVEEPEPPIDEIDPKPEPEPADPDPGAPGLDPGAEDPNALQGEHTDASGCQGGPGDAGALWLLGLLGLLWTRRRA